MTTLAVHGAAGNISVLNNGGAFTVDDFYVYPIYFGTHGFWWTDTDRGDSGNAYIGVNPGVPGIRLPPSFLFNQFGSDYTDIFDPDDTEPGVRGEAGAMRLPDDGSMFGQGGWWCFDDPFILYGTSGAVDAESISGFEGMNGKLLPLADENHFNGVICVRSSGIVVNGLEGLSGGQNNVTGNPAIDYTRVDTSDFVTEVGTWNTPTLPGDGYPYPNMRHAVVPNGGMLKVDWDTADVPLASSYHIQLFGTGQAQEAPANNHLYLNLPWNHSTSITHAKHVETFSGGTSSHTFSASASFAAWKTSTACEYWVDTANDRLYVHFILGDLSGANAYFYFNEP
jgi:hypothetical protein